MALGWYSWSSLGGRTDNCRVSSIKLQRTEELYSYVENAIQHENDYEKFSEYLELHYHRHGHSVIATDCKTKGSEGVMSYSEVSARDPIFYRWHGHIEDIMQTYRDTKLPSYTLEDFVLKDGIEVSNLKTIVESTQIETDEDLENTLVTHFEEVDIKHSQSSSIKYNRINHIPFRYEILLRNPRKSTKKVIVRIWLGLVNSLSSRR